MNNLLDLAPRLRLLREQHGLSISDVADRLDVSVALVRHWENGLRKPTLPMAVRIADLYKITVDELVHPTPTPA